MTDKLWIDEPYDEEYPRQRYEISKPNGGWRRSFDEDYIKRLRPIAETIALMDGNAFKNHWQGYLQEADAVYRNNGGDNGWPNECSWIKREKIIESDPVLKDLHDKLVMMLRLKGIDEEIIG